MGRKKEKKGREGIELTSSAPSSFSLTFKHSSLPHSMSSSSSTSPVIIVTGSSKGLGLSTLAILCGTPFSARVVSVSRSHSDDLLLFQKMYPDQILLVKGDVSLRATSQEAVDLALKTWGRLDGIVLNAGRQVRDGDGARLCLAISLPLLVSCIFFFFGSPSSPSPFCSL